MPQFRGLRRRRWRRTALLVPVILALLIVAVSEFGNQAIAVPDISDFVSSFKDPLGPVAARGVGEPGALLSIKPGPEERVLSSERERTPPLADFPELENPVLADTPENNAASAPADAPANGGTANRGFTPTLQPLRTAFDVLPQNSGTGTGDGTGTGTGTGTDAGTTPSTPGGDGVIPGDPGAGATPIPSGEGIIPIDQGPGTPVLPPVTDPADPGTDPGPGTGPGAGPGPGPGTDPPTPPFGPTDSAPGTIAVPEPASWTLLLLGLVAIARRRQSGWKSAH